MRQNLTSQRPRELSLVSILKSFEGELGKEKTWMAVLHTTIILSLLNLSKDDHRYIQKQQQIGWSLVFFINLQSEIQIRIGD
jgi:hypothetical protein